MKPSLLEQELAPLKAQIELARGRYRELREVARAVDAEVESYAEERHRMELLRQACTALDQLDQLEAGELFWRDAPEIKDPNGVLARLKGRIAGFDEKMRVVLDRQAGLKAQTDRCVDELEYLHDAVQDAYARDERREEEFAIERELSEVPYHPLMMPWSENGETDRRYRRTLSTALLLSLLLAVIIRTVVVPALPRPKVAEIPERLAMMVRQEAKKPLPAKKAHEEKKEKKHEEKVAEKKEVQKEEKKQAAAPQAKPAPAQERAKAAPMEQSAAPRRAENTGVLAFKESFRDLIDEAATPKLGTEARLSNSTAQNSGHALANRSLVSIQGGGGGRTGGGSGNAAVGRNSGSGGIGHAAMGRGGGEGNDARLGRGGMGVGQVRSAIAGTGSGEGRDSRPASGSGARPARTDEEIQILFDRYKAALYRIYNTELRKDPTLRGKMVLKITIEPSGAVSACAVESCNMDAPGFSSQIVERVKKFNFGPKDGVPKMTILYPIDFLPAR